MPQFAPMLFVFLFFVFGTMVYTYLVFLWWSDKHPIWEGDPLNPRCAPVPRILTPKEIMFKEIWDELDAKPWLKEHPTRRMRMKCRKYLDLYGEKD